MENLQFNSDKVAQLFYYDPVTDSYIPVSSLNPLPVHVDTTATVVIPSSLTVSQPTGTNLHTVVDSGSVTVVQPTGSNLHVVQDNSSVVVQNFPGQQHVLLDSSSVIIQGGNLTGITNPIHVINDTSSEVVLNFPAQQHVLVDSSALVSIVNFPASQHVTLDTSNVNVVNPVTVVQPTGSNLHVVLDSSAATTVNQNKLIRSSPVSVYAPGDNILVPGLSNKVIRVLAHALQSSGTVAVKFKDGPRQDITGAFPMTSALPALGISLSQPSYLFSTSVGNNLILNLSKFITVSGFLTYFYDDVGASTDNTWTMNDSYPIFMNMTFGT